MRKSRFEIRKAKAADAAAVSAIYNQEIDKRSATFNTEHVSAEEIREKILKGDDKYPTFVATLADSNDIVVGWASISPYSTRTCYSGVGEVSIYVQKEQRKRGIGKALLQSLIDAATQQGYWKLMGRIFVFNQASRALCKELGFREVGMHEKHSKLYGKWIDVIEVERLIPQNLT